jgi:hypothetical protein
MLLALLLAFATYGPIPASTPSASADLQVPTVSTEALIVDSGSTNRAGYRLRVSADGTTALQQGPLRQAQDRLSTGSGQASPWKKHVSAALVNRFFADLKAAGPLDRLAAARCMKSTSFGSTTQVGYLGKMSPDLTCPGTAAMRTLEVDAQALADAAGVTMMPDVRKL